MGDGAAHGGACCTPLNLPGPAFLQRHFWVLFRRLCAAAGSSAGLIAEAEADRGPPRRAEHIQGASRSAILLLLLSWRGEGQALATRLFSLMCCVLIGAYIIIAVPGSDAPLSHWPLGGAHLGGRQANLLGR